MQVSSENSVLFIEVTIPLFTNSKNIQLDREYNAYLANMISEKSARQ